jgi:hypothetical protein
VTDALPDPAGRAAEEGLDESASADLERIAAEAVDPSHLLDGENPETLQPHDAEHWVRVYSELLTFKRRLLSNAQQFAVETSGDAREEIAGTDLPVLDAQATKLSHRLDFWRRREIELRSRPSPISR